MSILTILQRQKFLDGGRGNLVQGFLQILLEELRKEREKQPSKPHFVTVSKEYFGRNNCIGSFCMVKADIETSLAACDIGIVIVL